MVQSQKVSPVAGSVSCSYFTACLTRELRCLWAAEGWSGERDKTKAFAPPCDCSDERPVGLAKASAASAALVGFSLCPASPPHFLHRSIFGKQSPAKLHLPPQTVSMELSFYFSDSTQKRLYSSSSGTTSLVLFASSSLCF